MEGESPDLYTHTVAYVCPHITHKDMPAGCGGTCLDPSSAEIEISKSSELVSVAVWTCVYLLVEAEGQHPVSDFIFVPLSFWRQSLT